MNRARSIQSSARVLGVTLGLLLLLSLSLAAAPPIGHTVSGTVTVNGETVNSQDLTIRVNGVAFTATTTASGFYGFVVPGDDPDTAGVTEGGSQGDPITFALDNIELVETVAWSSGADTTLNLTNGTLDSTASLPVSGTGVVTFTMTNGAPGVDILPNGADMGNTSVRVRANQECTTVTGESVRRCFNITVANTPGSPVPITFYFTQDQIPSGQSCTDLEVYHWGASGWEKVNRDLTFATDGRDCTSDPRAIRALVGSFSPFILKAGDKPTAITLASLSGRSVASRPINLVLLLTVVLSAWMGIRAVVRHEHKKES